MNVGSSSPKFHEYDEIGLVGTPLGIHTWATHMGTTNIGATHKGTAHRHLQRGVVRGFKMVMPVDPLPRHDNMHAATESTFLNLRMWRGQRKDR